MRALVPRNLFDSFFGTDLFEGMRLPRLVDEPWVNRPFYPAVDIEEKDEAYLITADVPGFKKDDVEVDLNDNVLTVTGRVESKEEETKEGEWVRRERRCGAFQRSFMLPDEVDQEAVDAKFEDGVLKIVLPKREPAKTAKRTVKIK